MTPEERIAKLEEMMAQLFATDRITLQKKIQIFDGRNIQVGKTTGTKIGTETDQKLGFFNATPVDKPEAVTNPTGGGDAGVDTPARNAINALIDRLQELGLIK